MNEPPEQMNFRTALKINNDIVKLLNAISEIEIKTDFVSEIKTMMIEFLEKEINKLDSSILIPNEAELILNEEL